MLERGGVFSTLATRSDAECGAQEGQRVEDSEPADGARVVDEPGKGEQGYQKSGSDEPAQGTDCVSAQACRQIAPDPLVEVEHHHDSDDQRRTAFVKRIMRGSRHRDAVAREGRPERYGQPNMRVLR